MTNRLQLAGQLSQLGRLDEALEIYEKLVPVYEQRLGRLHGQTLAVMNNNGMAFMSASRYEEAAVVFTEVLARKQEVNPEPNLGMADSLQNLGALMVRLERIPKAIEYLQAADAVYQDTLLPGNPLLAYPHLTLAAIYADLDDVDALETHARQADTALRGNVPDNHPAWLKSQCLVGDALLRRGNLADGERRVRLGLDGLLQYPTPLSRHIDECRAALRRAGLALASASD
jgi:tetratricopeptide (TPR) repeat protein